MNIALVLMWSMVAAVGYEQRSWLTFGFAVAAAAWRLRMWTEEK